MADAYAPITQFMASHYDDNGSPLAGARVYTFDAGTSTPRSTYDGPTSGASDNGDYFTLDSYGRAAVFGEGRYKFDIREKIDPSTFSSILTYDNVEVANLAEASDLDALAIIEKKIWVPIWEWVQDEDADIIAQAAEFSVADTTYVAKRDALNTYLTTTISNFTDQTVTTDLVAEGGNTKRETFNLKWLEYYQAKVDLLKAIQTAIDTKIDTKFNTDGTINATGAFNMGTNKITNTGNPSTTGDVVVLDGSNKVSTSYLPASVLNGVQYQSTWNASTNTPTLTSSVGTQGHYYTVSVAGATNLDGITDWNVGDNAIFNGTVWEKIDNTDQVASVFGRTGTVVAAASDYDASQIDNDSGVTGSKVSDALNTLNTAVGNAGVHGTAVATGTASTAGAATMTITVPAGLAPDDDDSSWIIFAQGQIIQDAGDTYVANAVISKDDGSSTVIGQGTLIRYDSGHDISNSSCADDASTTSVTGNMTISTANVYFSYAKASSTTITIGIHYDQGPATLNIMGTMTIHK